MLNLYRGDSLFNIKSKPGKYRSEGITSSALGAGGDPQNIERITLLETVKQHIDHLKSYEKEYYKITDYISFSESEETAINWAADCKPDKLVKCAIPLKETRYVFHLALNKKDLRNISNGVWEFNFACNTNLKSSNFSANSLLDHVLKYYACPLCGSASKSHSLLLIRPSVIMSGLNDRKYKRANNLAEKNDEWLVLPNDLIEHGHRGTRIPRADFWHVQHYILSDEPERDINFNY